MKDCDFMKMIDICSKQQDVKEEVYKNHDENMWLPMSIKDGKKRLLIAGLSTRISYNMILTYKKVIKEIDTYNFEEICLMSDERLVEIVKPLGLVKSRVTFLKSMIDFIKKYYEKIDYLTNDELIDLIAKEVKGASYKVGECCTLYLRGYYCGVIPVDSGMKDIQLPCMGFEYIKNSKGNKILSEQLKEIIERNDFREIIEQNGYSNLNIENVENPTWLIHLILIYYKRLYCNKKNPKCCKLYKGKLVEGKCDKEKQKK